MMIGRLASLSAGAALFAFSTAGIAAPPLSGAIFTTTVDGDIVNENVHYEAKEDVYLDGGPGPNAPSSAAGLPKGDYYFQVTDPSGKVLLSTDHISCRMFHVGPDGFIDHYYTDGTSYEKDKGEWVAVDCEHATGVDIDYGADGAITVQLYPYDDTPNKGGVYKVWITPIGDYIGDPNLVCSGQGQCNVNGEGWEPNDVHGFVPAASKTDNYKVKEKNGPPFENPTLTIRKFHDANNSGDQDGDTEITNWNVSVTDPLGVTNGEMTPVTIVAAEPGLYYVEEEEPVGTVHTYSYDVPTNLGVLNPVDVLVEGKSGETHEVWFGDLGLGKITACKVYDNQAETPIPGWKFKLTGTTVDGQAVGPTTLTAGNDGCAIFGDLLPGSYTVEELLAEGYYPSGPTTVDVDIESTLTYDGGAPILAGTMGSADFKNVCEGPPVEFGTKGYWHNKNGLMELNGGSDDFSGDPPAAVEYANGLNPYDDPSSYFDSGDEPFDGEPNVQASNGAVGEIAPSGTWGAEVSLFLVESNAGANLEGHREQLAQQLLAFIFNVFNRLGGVDALILVDGSFVSAGSLINQAVTAWASGSDADVTALQELLEGFNSNATPVISISGSPCFPITYSD
jgi:hypothetical protein